MKPSRQKNQGPDQRGFTLIEAMIVVLIMGIITAVVSQLLYGSIKSWTFNAGYMTSQREVRVARDMLDRFVRQAKASTVLLDSYGTGNPPLSMLSYQDALGNNRVFYQSGNKFLVGNWTLSGTSRVLSGTSQVLVTNYLQRATFYYPNSKDRKTLGFALYSVWPIPKSMANDIENLTSGDLEIRDP